MWWSRRPSRATKCASIWNTTCTECRQLFFEINSDIDNNPDKLAEAQASATANGISLYNRKVQIILNEMVDLGKISSDDKISLLECMSEE